MLQRLYVHNFRCLTNFEWSPDDSNHHLLLGKNGTGKSSLGAVLAILQKLGQGKNRIEDLLLDSDFGYSNMQTLLRIEIQVKLGRKCRAMPAIPERFTHSAIWPIWAHGFLACIPPTRKPMDLSAAP
jgi:ABC-type uncharacterized transport system ATPase component